MITRFLSEETAEHRKWEAAPSSRNFEKSETLPPYCNTADCIAEYSCGPGALLLAGCLDTAVDKVGRGIDTLRSLDFLEFIERVARRFRLYAEAAPLLFCGRRGGFQRLLLLHPAVDLAIPGNTGGEPLGGSHLVIRFGHSIPGVCYQFSGRPAAARRNIVYNPAMNKLAGAFLAFCSLVWAASSVYEFTMNSIDGKSVTLASYRGKVLMIVNVASRCGYTPQYAALEAVYEKYRDRGFLIAGFPANNFGGQEPGTNEEIRQFCSAKYNVKFPMFAKISVAGEDQAPLYHYLTAAQGGEIEWNFTKFLIDRNGKIARRFPSETTPDSPEVTAAIESALGK